MKEIIMCGSRGLGDVISGLSNIIKRINCDTHLKFCYPGDVPTYNYKEIFDVLMNNFVLPQQYKITYEYDPTWYTIRYQIAENKLGKEQSGNTWFFSSSGNRTIYTPFKTTWSGDVNGPIALSLNYEEFIANPKSSPYPKKFFSADLQDRLRSLIDNKNYFVLERNTTLQGCIDILTKCRYALGVEGAYTHLSNCTRTPFIIVRNNHDQKLIDSVHKSHPRLKTIETKDIENYLLQQ